MAAILTTVALLCDLQTQYAPGYPILGLRFCGILGVVVLFIAALKNSSRLEAMLAKAESTARRNNIKTEQLDLISSDQLVKQRRLLDRQVELTDHISKLFNWVKHEFTPGTQDKLKADMSSLLDYLGISPDEIGTKEIVDEEVVEKLATEEVVEKLATPEAEAALKVFPDPYSASILPQARIEEIKELLEGIAAGRIAVHPDNPTLSPILDNWYSGTGMSAAANFIANEEPWGDGTRAILPENSWLTAGQLPGFTVTTVDGVTSLQCPAFDSGRTNFLEEDASSIEDQLYIGNYRLTRDQVSTLTHYLSCWYHTGRIIYQPKEALNVDGLNVGESS
jgi:hypothetical protein